MEYGENYIAKSFHYLTMILFNPFLLKGYIIGI